MAHQRGDMNSAPTVTPGFQVFALDDADEGPRVYQRRKWHKKTREGCVACKSKRVKVCAWTFDLSGLIRISLADVLACRC